ncbi:hypothetical protein DVH24_014767 [Malus domestica]|uniref:Uncharacterized protein n=1 Tax=Malus domestica TaxID=3750 RepID=A0A498K279_MALDO|nr:hypothetical protein DVH24_014767 [Malus domestica]
MVDVNVTITLFDYSSFGEHDQYSLWERNTTITFTRLTGVKQHRVEEKFQSNEPAVMWFLTSDGASAAWIRPKNFFSGYF